MTTGKDEPRKATLRLHLGTALISDGNSRLGRDACRVPRVARHMAVAMFQRPLHLISWAPGAGGAPPGASPAVCSGVLTRPGTRHADLIFAPFRDSIFVQNRGARHRCQTSSPRQGRGQNSACDHHDHQDHYSDGEGHAAGGGVVSPDRERRRDNAILQMACGTILFTFPESRIVPRWDTAALGRCMHMGDSDGLRGL